MEFSKGRSVLFRLSERLLYDLLTRMPLYALLINIADADHGGLIGMLSACDNHVTRRSLCDHVP